MRRSVLLALLLCAAPALAQTPLTGTAPPTTAAPPLAGTAAQPGTPPATAPATTSSAGTPPATGASLPSTTARPTARHGHRRTQAQRFDDANTTHDGKLTLEQARAAHMNAVVRDFSAIDKDGKGYVTLTDIRQHRRAQRAARHTAAAPRG